MLWRACRGNVFLRQAEIECPLEDPVTVSFIIVTWYSSRKCALSVCVCMCVCVCLRECVCERLNRCERERVCVHVCVCVYVHAHVCV